MTLLKRNFSIITIVCLNLFSNNVSAQCINTTSYGTATAPTSGSVTISSIQYQTEYSTINSVIAGTTYESAYGAGGCITITSGSSAGPVVVFGPSPLQWTAATSGTYYVHYTLDCGPGCATATSGNTSTIAYISGGGGGCGDGIVGGNCANALVVNSLPYQVTGLTTCGAGDCYSSASACGSLYMTGEDYVLSFTPSATGPFEFITNGTTTFTGIFVLDGCPDSGGTNCIGSDTQSGGLPNIQNLNLTGGQTYYIVISTWSLPNCTPFDLFINEEVPPPGCGSNPPAGNTCATATPICDLTGYCGNTSNAYTSEAWTNGNGANANGLANEFCGSIENNSFISFIADAPSVSFDVIVSNCCCNGISGIQMMVFEGTCGSGPVTDFTGCFAGANGSLMPPGTNTIGATGLTPGNEYYLMIDGYNGDVCEYQIVVNNGVLLPANAGSDVSICPGGSTTLTATGGDGTYTWSPGGETTSSITVSPGSTATYSVSSNIGNPLCGGGITVDDVVVTVSAGTAPTITGTSVLSGTVGPGTGQTVVICDGGSANLTATGGGTYSWSPTTGLSSGTSATPVATPTSTTTYTVTVDDGNGCIGTATITVQVDPPPIVTVNSETICNGESVDLTASGASTYTWSPSTGLNQTTGSTVEASPTETTVYTVTGSTPGCPNAQATATVTLVSAFTPSFAITGDFCLATNSLDFENTTGNTGSSTYSWDFENATTGTSSSQDPSSISWGAIGEYDVTLTLTNGGCTETATTSITIVANPTVTVNSPTICAGQTAFLNASGGVFYSWDTGNTGNPESVSPAVTTSYVVTGTGANGCVNTATATVTVNPLPTITVNSPTICDGETATLTAAGGVSYSWDTGTNGDTESVSPAVTTSYVVTGTDANGCVNTATATVTVNPLPTITVNSPTICDGETATLTAAGGVSYSWDTGNTGNPESVSPTLTTSYVVTGTDVNGCVNTATATVTVNPLPTITVNSPTICDGETATLTAAGGVSYSWDTGNTGNPESVSPTLTTSYVVTGTDANGCVNTATATVTVNPLPTITVNSPTICDGETATLTAAGGVSYSWDTGNTGNPESVSPTVTTSYVVTGTDANGCVNTATATVTVNPLPTITVNSPTICDGETATLTAAGGVSYSWDTGNTGNPESVSPALTTSYVVTGTDANGCVNTATATVTVNPLPTITVNSPTICDGETATLTAAGGVSYSWDTGNTGNPESVSPAVTTSYVVTGTDVNGCVNTATATVTVNPLPTITVNSPTICDGETATLTAAGGVSYSWDTGNTGNPESVSPAVTTSYVVTGTDANGCINTATATVTVNPLPTITVNSPTICDGETATLTAAGGVSYSWDTGNTGNPESVSPTLTTSYVVTGTDANGCVNTATATVTVNPLPTIGVNPVTICDGETATLTATGGVSYSWDTGNTGNPESVSPTLTTSYVVTGTDANGCVNTATATVTVNPLPTITVNSPTICDGETATLTATGGVSYSWDTGTNGDTESVSPAVTTSYVVTGTDVNGCVNTATATVTVNPLPTITVNSPTICDGETATLTAAGGASYSWDTGNTGNPESVSPTVTTSYVVTGTDANGCVNTATATVTVNPLPTITVNSPTICDGETATLTAAGGVSYSWDTGNTGNPESVSPAVTTSYVVTGTDANGCVNTATATVTVNPLPTITVNSPTICDGETATLTAAGGVSYSWDTGNTGNPESVSPTVTTSYVVTGTDANGCVNTATATVTVNPLPTITVNSPTICDGETATLTAAGGVSYSWDTGNTGNPESVSPALTTSYVVTGTDANGCVNTATATVTVNPLPTITVNSPTICDGETATLTAAGGVSYSWDTGNTGNPESVSPTVTTSYVVTGTDANGCVNTATATVTVNPLPTITVNSPTICDGETATLTAAGGVSYSWDTGTTGDTESVSPAVTTSYVVTGTDANGCVNTATATVTVNPLPTITVNSPTICDGETATLTAAGGVSYSWDTGTTGDTESVSPAVTTSYVVTGTDANGCVNTVTATVTVNPLPTITLGLITGASCGINNGEINVSGSGGSGGLEFSIDGGANFQPTGLFGTLLPGVYTIIIEDDNGCENSVQATVGDLSGLTASEALVHVTCFAGNNGQATITATGGSLPYQYSIDGGITWESDPVFSDLIAGDYEIIVKDNNNCPYPVNFEIIQPPSLPNIGVNPVTICDGEIATLTATGGVSYSWDTGNTGNPESVSPTLTTSYVVTGTDANGCVNTATATVTVNPLPTITVNSPTICDGETATLTAAGGVSYSWDTGTNGDTESVSPAVTTSYVVTGTDANGCVNTATATVTVNPLPTITVNSPTICDGETATLTATGGVSYSWDTGNTGNPESVSPALTTSYVVTGTDANGCINTATATVTVNPLPTITVNSPTICDGETATLTATGGVSYSWDTGNTGNPESVSPTVTTSYVVTGTDANGCVNTATATVTVNPLPTITVNSPTICNGETATLTAAGGVSYSWDTGNTGNPESVSPTLTTSYVVTGTDANGCVNTATATVTVNPLPTITVNSPTICDGETATLTAAGGVSYSWDTGNTGNPESVSPTVTTSYVVTGTDANGCVNTATANVTLNPLPTITVNSPTICDGETATLTAAGGVSYSWDTGNTGNPESVSPTLTTSYVVTGTDANGCVNTATATVTVNPLPTIGVNPVTICDGETATLTATGGVSYSWDTGNTGNPESVSPTLTTSYVVTGTDANGCVNTATATVTVNPLPTITVNSPTICDGETATLTATGGVSYSWDTGTNGDTESVSPAVTTSYVVTGTDVNGCVNTATATVTVNPLPTITVNSPTICDGETATLTAAGGASYSWDTGNTGNPESVSPTVTTSYVVTGTDANGCVNTATATVTVNPLPTITVNSPTICDGETATLTAAGGVSYSWDTGTNGDPESVSPAVTTSYVVTGTDANGCVNTATATVTVNPLPTITVNSPTICDGETATLTAAGGVSYSWDTGTNGDTESVSPAVTTSYVVTGTDVNGCVNTATATVTVNPLPTITVNSPTICDGETATLTAAGGVSYSWDTGNTGNPESVSPAVTTSYVVTGTDANGCVNTATATVTVNPLPTITVNSPTICDGETATLTAAGGVSYSWDTGNTGNPESVSPTVTTSYVVTGTDANGCVNTATATVTVNPLPTITVNSPTICDGETATLTAAGGVSYSWDTGNTGNPESVSPTVTTSYVVTGTDANGCVNTATATVTVNPLPTITVNSPTICDGETATLTAAGGVSYSWDTGNTGNPESVSPAVTTSYVVTGTDANGCVNTATATVTVNPLPTITVNSPTICDGETATLTAAGGVSYSWDTGTTGDTESVSPAVTTSYVVTGTDANGCVNTATATVTVNPMNLTPSVVTNVNCNGENQGSVTVDVTGGTSLIWNLQLYLV